MAGAAGTSDNYPGDISMRIAPDCRICTTMR